MGWAGFLLVGVGAVAVWAGFTGEDLIPTLGRIMRNEPLPKGQR
jgi:hypothetical protein